MSTNLAHKTLKTFLELVAINSPSRHEEKIGQDLSQRLRALDIATETDTVGNLLGRMPASKGYEEVPPVLINCHMDTVPNAVNVKPVIKDGFVYSDGTTALGADDKAGIAAVLTALTVLHNEQIPHGPIVLLFTVVEEICLEGVKSFDVEQLKPIGRSYTLDAGVPVGTVIISAPSKSDATIVFHGKAAHAGSAPEKGISAISLAARAIDKMRLLRIDHETTANIGTIHAGTVNNIVPDCCEISLEVRSTSREQVHAHLAHLELCCIKAINDFGGSYDFQITDQYSGYKLDGNSPHLLTFKAICARLQLPYVELPSGGGSDANILQSKGIPIIALGTGYDKAHTLQESIAIQELENLSRLLIALLQPQED